MSGKASIKPIESSVYYYTLDPHQNPADKVRLFFSRLFSAFHTVDDLEPLTKVIAADSSRNASLVVFDLRNGTEEDFENFVSGFCARHNALGTGIQLALFDQRQSDRIIRLAQEGWVPRHVVMIPWRKGVLERVIEEIRVHLAQVRAAAPSELPMPTQLNTGGNREHIEKLNAANAYYADHSKLLQMEIKRLGNLAHTIANDEEGKALHQMGRLIQYADVLRDSIDELVQFSNQNWHSYQHQTVFDINTVLDTVSSTSIPFLGARGIELIFEVNNTVPSRLKGYPLGTTSALVTALELIAHADVAGELIMRISLGEPRGVEGAILNIQFMQHHYDSSVTDVILALIRKDARFKKLQEQMKEIEGLVLDTGHEKRQDIFQLSFQVQATERRSYRLPSRAIMSKKVLIIDTRRKNAEVLQNMLRYFHIASTISVQMEEALLHIEKHAYDIVIVTETLAKQCAKRCKKARETEKFIVINSERGGKNAYLGLDIADGFLTEPYTHKGIFHALVDIFLDENLEGQKKEMQSLRNYLSLMAQNRRILYVGDNGEAVRDMEILLEETTVRLETARQIPQTYEQYDFVLLEICADVLRNDEPALEEYLHQGQAISQDKRVVCVVPEDVSEAELDTIASLTFVITYIREPIDPEAFYRVLLDWATGN